MAYKPEKALGQKSVHPEPVLSYTLIRSRRKTLVLRITKDATIEVRAPLRMPVHTINRFVAAKEQWIASRLAMREQVRDEKAAFALQYGDKLPLCGREYPITAREGKSVGFDGACFFMPPGLPPEEIKMRVVEIYKTVAKEVIGQKVEAYAKQMQVVPARIRISSAKTRWGSCSGKKNLNFSWRLLMAEDSVIDYVVVHELAHLMELNHSARFWAHVEKIFPNTHEPKEKLRQLQKKLAAQDWD